MFSAPAPASLILGVDGLFGRSSYLILLLNPVSYAIEILEILD